MLSNTGINKVILLGQVTDEVQIKTDASRQRFHCFTMITNEAVKKGAENIEHFEYHRIKVPEKLVLQDNLIFEPGQSLYMEGKMQTTSYFDDRGIKRYDLEVIVYKLEILTMVPLPV